MTWLAADVRRMLAEVMAETRAGKMDPKEKLHPHAVTIVKRGVG